MHGDLTIQLIYNFVNINNKIFLNFLLLYAVTVAPSKVTTICGLNDWSNGLELLKLLWLI